MQKGIIFSIILILAIAIGVVLIVSKQGNKPDDSITKNISQTTSQDIGGQTTLKDTIENSNEPSATLADGIYSIDIINSKIKWFCVIHKGYVLLKSGKITIEDNKITKGSFEILMDSIVDIDIDYYLMKATLENTLKSNMFFDVRKYPESVFKITGVTDKGDNRYLINGDLKIKDIVKPVSFISTITIKNDTLYAKSERFSINRTVWGITIYSKNYPQTDDSFLFTDYIDFVITLVMTKEGE